MKFSLIDILLSFVATVLVILLTFASDFFLMKLLDLLWPNFVFFNELAIVIFLVLWVFYSIILLWALRLELPLSEGVFSFSKNRQMIIWKLQSYLYITHLCFFYNAGLLPINLRALFYRLLGARMGKSVMIGGKIIEPSFVEIGDYVQLGEDSLISAHVVQFGKVELRKVKIGNNVLVGAKALVLSGVEAGNGSVIAASAVVAKGTIIGENEIWGGIPAKKIGDTKGKRGG